MIKRLQKGGFMKYANLVDRVAAGPNPPQKVYCLVEIPKGGTNKYEYDKKYGVFKLDRVLYNAVFFPTEYGIIPQTKEGDGDPLDIMVLSSFSTFTGCLLTCRPVGMLRLIDTGKRDDKIIAVPCDDPRFNEIKELNDLSHHFKKEIANFWQNYSELQPGKKIKIKGWGGREAAYEAIKQAIRAYRQTNQ